MPLNILHLLNGTTQLIIAIFGIVILYTSLKKKRCRIASFVGAIGIFYLIFSLLNLSWFSGILEASFNDFIIINSLFISIISVLFLFVAYKLTNNKNLMYLLVIFLITLVALYSIFYNFLLINFISLLFLLILFLDLEFFSHRYLRIVGIAGIFYCIISLSFLVFIYLGNKLELTFMPDILMVYVFYNLMQHTKSCERRIRHILKKTPLPLQVIKFFLFIAALTLFMMFGTLAIHEIGHALTAKFYGCSYSAVVYQSGYFPYTDVGCSNKPNNWVILIGGMGLTSALALIFFLTGDEFIKYTSYLIFALGIIIASKDFIELGLSQNIIFVLYVIAIILIILSISKIVIFYIREFKKTRIIFCQKECKS